MVYPFLPEYFRKKRGRGMREEDRQTGGGSLKARKGNRTSKKPTTSAMKMGETRVRAKSSILRQGTEGIFLRKKG